VGVGARTGDVVAETPSWLRDKVYLGGSAVWDSDDSILFEGYEAHGEQRAALLNLKVDGTFDQASEAMKQPIVGGQQLNFITMSR